MNKIYKVVWSKAKNCYVVASEFAKNQSKSCSTKKVLAMMLVTGIMTTGGAINSIQAANKTNTKIPPKMVGYEQTWDTDVQNGKLGTSIKAYQSQGNNLQLNFLEFEKSKTTKGENSLTIRLGAYVDGVNKGGNLYFVDTNTKNTTLSTVIDNKGIIKSTLTDSDNKTVASTVDISKYVQGEVNKKSDYHLIANTAKDSEGVYKVDDAGNIELLVADDTNKKTNTVKISNVASKDSVAVVYDKNKTSLKTTNSNGVGDNAIALGKGAYAVKNSIAIGNGAYTQDGTFTRGQSVALGNGAVTGAKSTSIGSNAVGGREGTITIGANANNGAAYATIVGTDSKLNYTSRTSGVASTMIGAKNEIKNDNKTYSGVANGILGASNTIENSNGVTIQGSANTVTNAYRDMARTYKPGEEHYNLGGVSVKKDTGAVGILGGMNEVSDQVYTNVIGFGNTISGDKENSSHDVFLAGSRNKLTNISDALVMGNDNTITDQVGVISLGNKTQITANQATAIGNETHVSAEGGVAIGTASVADRVAGQEKGVVGAFAPDKIDATDQSTWISTAGAVSVGDTEKNITRQITHVAAGREDTDAVNVAQLNKVNENLTNQISQSKITVSAGKNINVTSKDNEYTVALDDVVKLGNDKVVLNGTHGTIHAATDGAGVGSENTLDFNENGLVITNNNTGKTTVNGDTLTIDGGSFGGQSKIFGSNAQFGNVHINNSAMISTITGLTNTMTDYAGFATSGRAATEEQLKQVKDTANTGWNLTAAHGETTTVKPGDTVDFSPEDTNLTVTNDGTNVKIGLNQDVHLTSATFGDTIINANGLTIGDGISGLEFSKDRVSVGGQRIHDVEAGQDDMDAVNVSQLNNVKETANKGWNLSTNGGEAAKVAPGETVDFTGDENISVNNTGKNVTTTLNKNLKGIETIANGPSKVVLNEGYAGMAYGNTNIVLMDNGVYLNGKVNVDKAGQIHNVTAGTADDDAVNVSQLNKETAASKTTISDGTNTTVTSTIAEDGHTDYKVNLNKELEGIESISNGDAKINLNDAGIILSKGNDKIFSITDTGMGMSVIGDDYQAKSIMVTKNGTVISGGLSVAGSKITNVAAGTADTDAVNLGQLNEAVSKGNTDTHIDYSKDYTVGADNKVSMDVLNKNGEKIGDVTISDVAKASDVGDVTKIASDIKNKEGNTTVVDAVNNLNEKVGDLNYSNVGEGNILDGDNTTTAIGKLNKKLGDVEKTAGKHSSVSTEDSNLSISEGTNTAGGTDYKVSLNKDLQLDSVTTGDTKMDTNGVQVGNNVSLTKDGLTAGDTKVTNDGLSIGGKNYVTKDGLNANDNKVTGVKDGDIAKGSTDAVNGGQLYETNQAIANNATNISSLSHSLSNLDNRVNKVGAGAAALAALHPLDFDPDAKWDFAAGYGNYRGTNAAAIGAYYRPNEDAMFSVGGTFGNGENMVNAGVSFKLGAGSSHVSTSRVAMAKEIKELRSELEAMKSAMLDANAGKKIDTSKLQLFPDVPQNHWAYEYVAQLAGNGMIDGYPDGSFAGDRPMTRYEFAAILYRAMTKGAVLSDKILNEFSHELEYFTVDTVAKDKAGNPTIQRVRTVKDNKNK